MRIAECNLIISEGRNRKFIQKIRKAISKTPGCELAYIDAYHRKNYMKVSFFGEPKAVLDGSYQVIALAEKEIDMRNNNRDPSRIGVIDSVRFSPIVGLGLSECAALSQELGCQVAHKLSIPVYFYGSAIDGQALRKLDDVRQGGYKGLSEAIHSPERAPDIGKEMHTTAGAIAIGAGGTSSGADAIIIMLNIELRKELATARKMRSSLYASTRIKGYLRTISAVTVSLFKTLIYSRSWWV